MPWVDLTYDQRIEIYEELWKEIINKPISKELAIFEMMVRAHVSRYNFTKRQLVIINFIMSLSFGLKKREAYIPKLQDFSLAGISFKKIRNELNKLLSMNVIFEDQEYNLFSMQDPREWEVPDNNPDFDINRSRELFYFNMELAGIDIAPLLKKRERE